MTILPSSIHPPTSGAPPHTHVGADHHTTTVQSLRPVFVQGIIYGIEKGSIYGNNPIILILIDGQYNSRHMAKEGG